ncbi:MAG: recombinase [Nitrospirae bacterium CG_4_10_14_0_8_um_filter_41_23]|nr:MAG: recombinase [Nitrospirae bacterium CG11_big_fil_rev_8_21_14_0_20_41_14]PIV43814.1 MAG: recombinase [Nitrospirae bacterium CG02_land_8_20_14_3_00_41_53]PIW87025.1 MAG: recombinase [Nitrospirae bacterium CG_4_8_14_3_um_filter_41_47]PIY87207.1 MAG: recombinase [Nitrospirae bacterium CG_4_10_14_0_8_um_filter_41_23]PJA79176.1 MAG: recombinase [Nitrospirae bacterium CG_4_9_14_3_um_filter_41_27]
MDSYEQYEKECKRIRKDNEEILADFEKWLSDKKLSKKTIKNHYSNVDFYINDFLLYEDAIEAAGGTRKIGMFLGYWFIRKAMWANKAAIKENAASLKKFYQFMLEGGKITKESFEDLKETIKEEMPEWLATMERYDDPDIEDSEEIWGI